VPLVSFVLLAYAVSWAMWLPLLIGSPSTAVANALYYGGVVGPAIAAVVVSRSAADLRRLATNWRVPLRWYLIALLLPPAVRALGILGLTLMNAPMAIELRPLRTFLPFAITLLFLVFFEELGWRGYALPELQRRHSPLYASLVVGVIWGVWHAPLAWASIGFQRSDEPLAYLFRFIVTILPISCLATWLFNRAGGSVIVATVYHFSVNISESVLVLPEAVGNSLLWVTAAIGTMIVAALLWRHATPIRSADQTRDLPPQT
jgi:uncharacterized protein